MHSRLFRFWLEKIAYAGDQILRLKRFANQFIRADRDRFVGDAFVDHAGHQNHWRFAELRMLLDLAADRVAVLIGHDDVGDDRIGRVLLKLRNRGGGVAGGDHRDVFAAESDLDDFAHGGAVVDKIDGVRALCGRVGLRRCGWELDGLAHSTSAGRVTTDGSSVAECSEFLTFDAVADSSTSCESVMSLRALASVECSSDGWTANSSQVGVSAEGSFDGVAKRITWCAMAERST